jgi:hypothetical protein
MKKSQFKEAVEVTLIQMLNEGEFDTKRYQNPNFNQKTWDLDSPTSKPIKTTQSNPNDPKWQYENGKKWGVKDKLAGTERELDKYPDPFVKGYKEVQSPGWWTKFNDKLTQLLAQLGSGANLT